MNRFWKEKLKGRDPLYRDKIDVDRLKMENGSQTRFVRGWEYEGVTWRALAKTIMNLRRLWKKEHLLSIFATVTFWVRKNYSESYSSIRRTERVINPGQIYGGLRLPKLFTLVSVYTIYFRVYRTRIITSLFVITVAIDSEGFSNEH